MVLTVTLLDPEGSRCETQALPSVSDRLILLRGRFVLLGENESHIGSYRVMLSDVMCSQGH
jgi:hypothetical protein